MQSLIRIVRLCLVTVIVVFAGCTHALDDSRTDAPEERPRPRPPAESPRARIPSVGSGTDAMVEDPRPKPPAESPRAEIHDGSSGPLERVVPASARVSSSLSGHPVEHALDGDESTHWLSKPGEQGWVEFDFGRVLELRWLHWSLGTNPAGSGAFRRFHVWVSEDGENFRLIQKRVFARPDYPLMLQIDRFARFVRIDFFEVGAATGDSAVIAKLWAEASAGPPACDATAEVGQLQRVLDQEATWRSDNSTHRVICLRRGLHGDAPYLISDTSNLTLRPLDGLVVVKSELYATDGRKVGGIPVEALLTIRDSANILLQGIEFQNTARYQPRIDTSRPNKTVVRTLVVANSDNVELASISAGAGGKGNLRFNASGPEGYRVTNGFLAGSYFVAGLNRSTVRFSDTTLESNVARVLPNDGHTILWAFEGRYEFANSHFHFITGRGLVSGMRARVEFAKRTSVRGTEYWAHSHPNYPGLEIVVSGDYPPLTPFYENPFGGGGMSPGSSVCSRLRMRRRNLTVGYPKNRRYILSSTWLRPVIRIARISVGPVTGVPGD